MCNSFSDVKRKNPEREEIERLTREFIEADGVIKKLDPTESSQTVLLSKRAKERGNDEAF